MLSRANTTSLALVQLAILTTACSPIAIAGVAAVAAAGGSGGGGGGGGGASTATADASGAPTPGIATPTAPAIEVREQSNTGPVVNNGEAAALGRAFGTQVNDSAPISIVISNPGSQPLSISEPVFNGGDTGQFTLDVTGFPVTLQPGESQSFITLFTPTAEGFQSTNIQFDYNTPGQTRFRFSFGLSGTRDSSNPNFQIRENETTGPLVGNGDVAAGGRDFGSLTDTPLTLVVFNTGSGGLLFGTPTLSGADADAFTLDTSSFQTAIPAGGSGSFTVSFTPAENGLKSATISLTHNASPGVSSPFTFDVVGTVGVSPARATPSFDFNGDGLADYAVVDRRERTGPELNQTGAVSIYLGSAGPINPVPTPDVKVIGENNLDLFGQGANSAGDFNNDGFDDLIVGATSADVDGNPSVGKVYVFFGSASPPSTIQASQADIKIFGSSAVPVASFVGCAGDFNGDGIDDIVLARLEIQIFFGRENPPATLSPATADIRLVPSARAFGEASRAGDVNGDGIEDLVFGGGPTGNQAYIFYGSRSPLSFATEQQADVTITTPYVGFGNEATVAGDVNGDGFSDFLISSGDERDSPDRGTYLFLGGANLAANLDETSLIKITDAAVNRMSEAGDFNNDGFDDFIVGDSSLSRARVYFGSATPQAFPSPGVTFSSNNSIFGRNVSSVGDLNGDGLPEIMVGGQNQAFVFFSGAAQFTDSDDADLTLAGPNGLAIEFGKVVGPR